MEHWPTPTLSEIKDSTDAFCALDWRQSQAIIGGHKYTTEQQFPYRCMEVPLCLSLVPLFPCCPLAIAVCQR